MCARDRTAVRGTPSAAGAAYDPRMPLRPMHPLAAAAALCGALLMHACSSGSAPAPEPAPLLSFTAQALSREFWAESVAAGDLNRDGHQDLVTGPFWWAGPTFTQRRELRAARTYHIDNLSDSFLVFVEDVDEDGWLDVVNVALPGQPATWLRNPQNPHLPNTPHWQSHLLWHEVGAESPALVDLDGDGRRELLCTTNGYLTWLDRDPGDPLQPWRPHAITMLQSFPTFLHGLGTGDVNGDGRQDVIVATGWFEQPPSLQGDPPWTAHPYVFGGGSGGAQMLVTDVDGDGDQDVVTSIHAHGYGLSWFEQVPNGGAISFVEHGIQQQTANRRDPHQFSQLHALALADVDGDGLQDVVTGKRFWAHDGADPGARDPAVLYWFRLVRDGGGVRFVPQRVHDDSGVGLQVLARDLNGDGHTDLASANKKGVHVFLSER